MEQLSKLKLDAAGLITAVAQDHLTGDIRMVAWMNLDAVKATLQSGKATFFSRSKGRLWVKGESSGHYLNVLSIHCDCDADTLLLRVSPAGPSCHTGRPTCFFQMLTDDGQLSEAPSPSPNFLSSLEREIEGRQQAKATKSYTRALLDGGAPAIAAKVLEEAQEFCDAMADESAERVASEAADVVYHLMVGLRHRGVELRDVLATLDRRSGVSGLQEKASRAGTPP